MDFNRRTLLAGSGAGLATTIFGPSLAASASEWKPNQRIERYGTIRGDDNVSGVAHLLRHHGVEVEVNEHTRLDGEAMRRAVATFQERTGLDMTGEADPKTAAALTDMTLDSGDTGHAVRALIALLTKHGYGPVPATDVYDDHVVLRVASFQTSHQISPTSAIGPATWRTLLSNARSLPGIPMLQRGTTRPENDRVQWTNCGPVVGVMLTLMMGKKPALFDGDSTDVADAVLDFRYQAMGVDKTIYRDNLRGTEFPDFERGLGHYDIPVRQVGTQDRPGVEQAMSQIQAGIPSIIGGDVNQMPYPTPAVGGPASHWVLLFGAYRGTYLVLDPIGEPAAVQSVTADQLRTYAATNPGYGDSAKPWLEPAWRNTMMIY